MIWSSNLSQTPRGRAAATAGRVMEEGRIEGQTEKREKKNCPKKKEITL